MTKKALQKVNWSNLSSTLRENEGSLILRESLKLTSKQILDTREAYEDLCFELFSAKNSLKFLQESTPQKGKKKEWKQHITDVKTRISELAAQVGNAEQMCLMGELRKQDEEGLWDMLRLLIIYLVRSYHTTEIMNEQQVDETATRIMYTFGGLTVEDVAVCFNEGKNGKLGKIFNRVDVGVIMDWLQNYQGKVQAMAMEHQLSLHINSKGNNYKNKDLYRKVNPTRLREYL